MNRPSGCIYFTLLCLMKILAAFVFCMFGRKENHEVFNQVVYIKS